MSLKLFVLFVLGQSVFSEVAVEHVILEKPDYVETCYIKKPREEFEKCSTKAVQRLFNIIPKGIPEIGLEPLDPFKIPVINVLQGGGPVSVNASLTNVTAVGFGNVHILSNYVDPKNYDFFTKLRLPKLRIDGDYSLSGRILLIPLRGKGTCWFEAKVNTTGLEEADEVSCSRSESNVPTKLDKQAVVDYQAAPRKTPPAQPEDFVEKNLDIYVHSDVDLYKKLGFNFYNVTDVHVKFSIGNLKLYMGNLFDGIKALEETTNAYLNANWKPVAESLNPILSQTIEDIMLDILQKVFHSVPADFFVADFD